MQLHLIPFILLLSGLDITSALSLVSPFSYAYSIVTLTSSLPASTYYAACFLPSDPNTLLAGDAEGLFSVSVSRNSISNHITGFDSPTLIQYNAYIGGSLIFTPQNAINPQLLIWPDPSNPFVQGIGYLNPPYTTPAVPALAALPSSVPWDCTPIDLQIVPNSGYAGYTGNQDQFLMFCYMTNEWYAVNYTISTDGVLSLDSAILLQTLPFSSGYDFIPYQSPLITDASILLSSYGSFYVYQTNSDGSPNAATGTVFANLESSNSIYS